MVVPPIAIYGALATTKTLAQELYVIIEDAYKSRKDLEKLRDMFCYTKLNFDAITETLAEISSDLRPDLANFVAHMIGKLDGKFTEVKTKLEGYFRIQMPIVHWHFVKDAIEQGVGALREWTRDFWQLHVMLPLKLQLKFQERMVSDKFKAEINGPFHKLDAHIRVKQAQLDFEKEDIEQALATMTPEPPDRRRQDVREYRYPKDIVRIPDHIQKDEEQLRNFKLEVARLTAVLSAADPKLTYLPKAISWFQRKIEGDPTPTWLGIAYEVYENMVPEQISLKDIISMSPPQHSLGNRIRLVIEFVSAMAYLRGLQWVHKAIRSTNVLLCYGRNDKRAPVNLGYVNLIGFNVARRGTGDLHSSTPSVDNLSNWRDQVYCHPERQTINMDAEDRKAADIASNDASLLAPTSHAIVGRLVSNTTTDSVKMAASTKSDPLPYYRYMHDIYGIGVVLLEIGLWRDLTPSDSPLRTAMPEERQQILLRMAREELPRAIGGKYASIVKTCLEADDEGPLVSGILSRLAEIHI